MARKKSNEHPSGVDRWTSNGSGISAVGKMSDEHKRRVAEVNRELAANKTGKKSGKKK